MATQPGPGAQRSVCPQGDSHFEVSSAGSYAPYPFKIAVMEIKRAPIPISELAMIAIQMRYIDFTAPPTHRSLASHIGQVIELSRRVSAAKNNVRKIAIQSLLAVM